MLDFLKRFLRRTRVVEAPIIFYLDRSEADQHIVRASILINGEETPIENLDAVRRYGFKRTIETESEIVTYVLSNEDRLRLTAIHSVAAGVTEDGSYRFDFAPNIFSYLRQAPRVEETEPSRRLRIIDQPPQPAAEIRFDPESGLEITPALRLPESNDLIPVEELQYTADGDYIYHKDVFMPVMQLDPEGQALLEGGKKHIDLEDVPEFFVRDLVLLRQNFEAILIDDASRIEVDQEPLKPIVFVDSQTPGWLDFQVAYTDGTTRFSHDQMMSHDGENYLKTDATTWVKIPWKEINQVQSQLDALEAEETKEGYRLPIIEFASIEEFIDHIGGIAELGKAYQEFIEFLSGHNADPDFRLSETAETDLADIGIQLRPYQRAGIHWLHWLNQNHLHGILADDMGLGKTIQSIMALRSAYEETGVQQHSLVIAPLSVLPHWERELRLFFPSIHVERYHGARRDFNAFSSLTPTVFVSTYNTVSRDIDGLKKIAFFYLILDEATQIKNPSARRSQAIKSLNAVHRLALSGTPIENRPAELWSIYDFLMPGHLGKYGTFQRVFEDQITSGDTQAAQQLGRRIRPFILRRLKKDVAKDLPEKIEMDEWCQLTDEQRMLYRSYNNEIYNVRASLMQGQQVNYASHILPLITKLKQICDHPALITKEQEPILGRSNKFDWIMDRIERIVAADEQVVIFSHFLGMLDLLEEASRQQGFEIIRIDGSVGDRQRLIDRFNTRQADIALISLLSGGYGINLTAANHVIHADRWWNPAVENQATDRVHRIGQEKTVYVYRILVEDTLEERIALLLEAKQRMADNVIGAATKGDRQWSREELLQILQPLPDE